MLSKNKFSFFIFFPILLSLLETGCYLSGTVNISPEAISFYESSKIIKFTSIDKTEIIFDKEGGRFIKIYGSQDSTYKIIGNDKLGNKIEKNTKDVLTIHIESEKYYKYSSVFIIPLAILGLLLLIPIIFLAFHPFHNS
jgi:hypothetical protein